MDEQINGTQTPKRRRRAEAQKKAFEEFDRLQQEELASGESKQEDFEQTQLHTHTDEEFLFLYQSVCCLCRKFFLRNDRP